MSKFRAFAITLSPIDPIEGKLQEEITKWLETWDYAYGIIEGDGKHQKRHFHGVVFSDFPKEKGSLKRFFVRLLARLSPDSNSNAIQVKACYNEDWKEEYLSKDIQEELVNAVPEDTGAYYPSLMEQAKVLDKANAVDKKYHQMEIDFKESIQYKYHLQENRKVNIEDISEFMHSAYYCKKIYRVEPDKRKRTQTCKSLLEYVLSDISRYRSTCISDEILKKEREKALLEEQAKMGEEP